MRIKQMIINGNLSTMKNKVLPVEPVHLIWRIWGLEGYMYKPI